MGDVAVGWLWISRQKGKGQVLGFWATRCNELEKMFQCKDPVVR
jgi:hypothetical protein